MLRWNFDDKIGEAVIRQGDREYTMNLYDGNAFLIFVDEYKDVEGKEMYSVWLFFADEEHAKSCLGLSKNNDGNIFDERNELVRIRINKKEGAGSDRPVSGTERMSAVQCAGIHAGSHGRSVRQDVQVHVEG